MILDANGYVYDWLQVEVKYFSRAVAYNVLKLPIWAYDEHVRRWIPKDSVISRSRKPYVQTSLRVVTYNIWFSRVHQPLRLQRLNALLLKSGAHVICMQEST